MIASSHRNERKPAMSETLTAPPANATGGRNAVRLVADERELGDLIEIVLQRREQATDWHEIPELGEFEEREAARDAFGKLRDRYAQLTQDLEDVDSTRELLSGGRDLVNRVIPQRAAPSPAMMADRPTLTEAFVDAVERRGRSGLPVGSQAGEGIQVLAEDVNLAALAGPTRMFATIDIGTGTSGLNLPQGVTPGTAPAFGGGVMAIDLFEFRAWTMPETAGPRWRARTGHAAANTLRATGSNDAVGEIAVYDDPLVLGSVYADIERLAAASSADAVAIAMDDLEYEYRAGMSFQAVQGTGGTRSNHRDDNHGFAAYTGGSGNAGRGAVGTLAQAANELTLADTVEGLMDLRSTLSERGWSPMTIMLSAAAFAPLTTGQISDGTNLASLFGALFAEMNQSLRGMRIYEVVVGFPANANGSTVAILYPFSGLASAVHYARAFEILRDPYTQAGDAEVRYRLFSYDALKIKQPIAIGELNSAAS